MSESSTPSVQAGWRWCHKCQGLYFGENPGSRCPAGGNHDHTGSGNYCLAQNSDGYPGQQNWRWCHKCQGLYFAGHSGSHCPAGGAHDRTGSGDYALVNQNPGAPGQHGWRWCHKCQGLFFGGNAGSVCPAGGAHDATGSGDYALLILEHRRVLPQETDGGMRLNDIRHCRPVHIVYRRPDEEINGKLLVFLPGSGGVPSGSHSEFFVQVAAWSGYHAIGLVYVNDYSVSPAVGGGEDGSLVLCTRKDGLDQFAQRHRDNLVGKSGSLYVDPSNSIQNRLVKLLEWLKRHDEAGNWQKFLNGSAPKWESITFAGHSQGGGMCAFIGMKHKIHRAVMMSSPSDGFDAEIAPWPAEKPATDRDRFFGFANPNDPRFARIPKIWNALGVRGELDSIDNGKPPRSGVHKVTTSVTEDAHNSVMQPAFLEVWKYLIGA